MSSRAFALLLLMPLAALAQNEGGLERDPAALPEAAATAQGGVQFEQTSPPSLSTEEYSPLGEPPAGQPEPDPAAEKVRQVRELLDTEEPAPAPAESVPSSATRSLFVSTMKAISSLCVVMALFFLAAFLFKRFGGKSPLLAGGAMGQVLGRVHLDSKNALYFVRTAGKILVVGVSPAGMAPVAEFGSEAFESAEDTATQAAPASVPESPAPGFKQQLTAGLREVRAPKSEPDVDDEEIAALRRDVRRLQQLLQDSSSERQI